MNLPGESECSIHFVEFGSIQPENETINMKDWLYKI